MRSQEIDQLADVIVNDIQPVDELAGKELLRKLQRGQIRIIKKGYGFTNPINGRMAMTECFFTAEKTYQLLRNQILDARKSAARWKLKNEKLISNEKLAQGMKDRIHPFDPSFEILDPKRTTSDAAWRVLFSSLLVHENIHLRQGRRYLKIGAIITAAASNISSAFGKLNPAEMEAYDAQADYLSAYADHHDQDRSIRPWESVVENWARAMVFEDAGSTIPGALAFTPNCR